MREFNIFGPVNPTLHYHVNRVAVKAALRERIVKGRYLTAAFNMIQGYVSLESISSAGEIDILTFYWVIALSLRPKFGTG